MFNNAIFNTTNGNQTYMMKRNVVCRACSEPSQTIKILSFNDSVNCPTCDVDDCFENVNLINLIPAF